MEDKSKKLKLHKSLQLYFSKKFKIPPIHIPSKNHPANITSSRLISTCRFPRTPSLTGDHNTTDTSRDQAATLSDIDRFLFENFRSLYVHDGSNIEHFSSSPGTSTSHINETKTTTETSLSPSSSLPSVTAGIRETRSDDDSKEMAVMIFSMDPYTDFWKSMQKMIKTHHGQKSQPLDWDFMEELLFYYLQLNDQCVHKYILKAFADLTAGIHQGIPGHGNTRRTGKSVSRKYY